MRGRTMRQAGLMLAFLLKIAFNNDICVPDIQWKLQTVYVNSTYFVDPVPQVHLASCVDYCVETFSSDWIYFDKTTKDCFCFEDVTGPLVYSSVEGTLYPKDFIVQQTSQSKLYSSQIIIYGKVTQLVLRLVRN